MMSSQPLQLQIAILPQETTPPLLGSHAAADEDDHSNVSMAMVSCLILILKSRLPLLEEG